MWKQKKDFNPRKAGTQRGWCLRNVRMGYGIAPKYESAWQAWQNSRQRKSAIPKGVEVPVYFWWGRYGHIGVVLADGRFWSDGRIYSSLRRYRVTHPAVVYQGWSEEVNDVDVLKYVRDTTLYYTVKRGDNLSKIAKRYGTTWQQLYKWNRNMIGNDPNLIQVGMRLRVR